MPRRVSFLVDGFNVYHSLCELERLAHTRVRWLDLRRLCESYLHAVRGATGERTELVAVHYFAALPRHLADSHPRRLERHTAYVAALKSTAVRVNLSQFKPRTISCTVCGARFTRFEEKETDVAIGVTLLDVLCRDECDVAVLMTGDTDLLPAVRTARALHPGRSVGIAFPFLRHSVDLRNAADFAFTIGQKDVQRAQLPAQLPMKDGSVITRPSAW